MTPRRRLVAFLAVAATVALVIGLVVFKPWLLFVDVRVDDALPPAPVAPTSTTAVPTGEPTAPANATLLAGEFLSHEHETTGTASIVKQADGTRLLVIENLDTTNGPDVHVWLSQAEAVSGREGWGLAGTADYVDLGPIKGNQGNQVYEIPAGTDLAGIRSVSLWCVQFSVSFGAAPLAA